MLLLYIIMSSEEKKVKFVNVPEALFQTLQECREKNETCNNIKTFNWVLVIFIVLIIVGSYYHIQSLGGVDATMCRYGGHENFITGGPPSAVDQNPYTCALIEKNKISDDEKVDTILILQKIQNYNNAYGTSKSGFINRSKFVSVSNFVQDLLINKVISSAIDASQEAANLAGEAAAIKAQKFGASPEQCLNAGYIAANAVISTAIDAAKEATAPVIQQTIDNSISTFEVNVINNDPNTISNTTDIINSTANDTVSIAVITAKTIADSVSKLASDIAAEGASLSEVKSVIDSKSGDLKKKASDDATINNIQNKLKSVDIAINNTLSILTTTPETIKTYEDGLLIESLKKSLIKLQNLASKIGSMPIGDDPSAALRPINNLTLRILNLVNDITELTSNLVSSLSKINATLEKINSSIDLFTLDVNNLPNEIRKEAAAIYVAKKKAEKENSLKMKTTIDKTLEDALKAKDSASLNLANIKNLIDQNKLKQSDIQTRKQASTDLFEKAKQDELAAANTNNIEQLQLATDNKLKIQATLDSINNELSNALNDYSRLIQQSTILSNTIATTNKIIDQAKSLSADYSSKAVIAQAEADKASTVAEDITMDPTNYIKSILM